MKKVYCGNCRYYVSCPCLGKELCQHENNKEVSDSHVRQVVHYKKEPMEINKHNDCPWFKKFGSWSLFN